MIRAGLEAGSVADVVDFSYQGAGSEATPPRRPADWAGLAGAGLMGASVVLGLVCVFLVRQELFDGPAAWDHAGQLAYLLESALDIGALVASAGLVVLGSWPTAAPGQPYSHVRRRVCGGLLGASVCAANFASSLVTIGYAHAGLDMYFPSLLLDVTWWLPAAAGSGLSLFRKGGLTSVGRPGRPRRADAVPLALLAITVLGALVNSLPAWVQYTFTGSMGPHSEDLTTFYTAPWIEFGGPWLEMAASIGQLIVLVAIAAAAGLWRPARFGAVILAGVVLSLIGSAITGVGDVIEAPPRSAFGIPAAARMTVSVAGTPWLWAFCGFTAALIAVHGWLFIRSRPRPRPAAGPVTWMESPASWTADEPLLLPPSPAGEAAFVRENVVGTPYSGEL